MGNIIHKEPIKLNTIEVLHELTNGTTIFKPQFSGWNYYLNKSNRILMVRLLNTKKKLSDKNKYILFLNLFDPSDGFNQEIIINEFSETKEEMDKHCLKIELYESDRYLVVSIQHNKINMIGGEIIFDILGGEVIGNLPTSAKISKKAESKEYKVVVKEQKDHPSCDFIVIKKNGDIVKTMTIEKNIVKYQFINKNGFCNSIFIDLGDEMMIIYFNPN